MSERKRALISIGTNSTRVLIVRCTDGEFAMVLHESREPRLGDGLKEHGPLEPSAVERTLAVVREFVGIANEAGASIEGIATSALRRATDGERFRERFSDISRGATLRILTGDEEAAFSYLGATHSLRDGGMIGSLDVGGGSTDFACGRSGTVERTVSCEVGAVRLQAQFPDLRDAVAAGVESDGAIAALIAEARAYAARRLCDLRDVPTLERAIVVGGTVFTTAAIVNRRERGELDGVTLSRGELAETLSRLLRMTLAQRRELPFMTQPRADILPAGMIVVDEALAALRVEQATLSRNDLLIGYLNETGCPAGGI